MFVYYKHPVTDEQLGRYSRMEKITERQQIDTILDELCEEYLHMVRVFAESLRNEQDKN